MAHVSKKYSGEFYQEFVTVMPKREAVLAALKACGSVRMTGAYTHFSDADGNEAGEIYSEEQFRRFLALTEGLGVTRHCANSAAALRHPEWALDMVREGISFYGYPPVETGLDLRKFRDAAVFLLIMEMDGDA